MSDPRITAGQLRGSRWQETLHDKLRTVDDPVDPLVERAAEQIAGRYREPGNVEDLDRNRVAAVATLLNGRDLPAILRWLLRLPYVLVRAVEWAQRQEPPDDESLTDLAVEYVQHETVPLLARLLVREAARPESPHPAVRELGLPPGELDEDSAVERLLERGVEIREGLAVDAVAGALADTRDARPANGGRPGGRPPAEEVEREALAAGTPAGDYRGKGLASLRPGCGSALHDVDCGLTILDRDDEATYRFRTSSLRAALALARLYLISERQPMLLAMEVLRDRAMTTELLTSLDDAAESLDDLCDLRLAVLGWDQELLRLTVERRATAAAAIGICDPASPVPANTRFSTAMEQLLQLLAALATDCCDDTLRWLRPAVRVASLRVVAALDGAMTGETLLTIGLWRRQFTVAYGVLTSDPLRQRLGVIADPDCGPAPAIRRILPDASFDPAALAEEWRALRIVFRVVGEMLLGPRETGLDEAAEAAVTLLVLHGRFRVPSSARMRSGGSVTPTAAGV